MSWLRTGARADGMKRLVACFCLALSTLLSVQANANQETGGTAGNSATTPPAATPPQESTPPATTPPAGATTAEAAPVAEKSLAELLADWAILEQRMTDSESKFNATTDALEKQNIQFDYNDLLNEANKVINRIRELAKQEMAKENGDPAALKTLMGILANDAQNDRPESVLAEGDFLISKGVDPRYFEKAASLERLSITAKEIFEELAVRQKEAGANDLPRVKLTTTQGEIVVELFENEAPNTVANFISLVESGHYNGLTFHRVLDGFMAQTGCPKGDGTGGPGYNIACECYSPEARQHFPGSLSMAKGSQRDSGGSQFFMCFTRSEAIRNKDGKHTVFGRIVSGMDVLKKILPTHTPMGGQEVPIADKTADKILTAEVVRKREHEYKPVKVGEAQAPAEATPPANANPPAENKPPVESGGGQP